MIKKRKVKPKKKVVTKAKKHRFKKGEFVYSHLNPTEKRQIHMLNATGPPSYKLMLSDPKGSPKLSPWINEKALSKRKKK